MAMRNSLANQKLTFLARRFSRNGDQLVDEPHTIFKLACQKTRQIIYICERVKHIALCKQWRVKKKVKIWDMKFELSNVKICRITERVIFFCEFRCKRWKKVIRKNHMQSGKSTRHCIKLITEVSLIFFMKSHASFTIDCRHTNSSLSI